MFESQSHNKRLAIHPLPAPQKERSKGYFAQGHLADQMMGLQAEAGWFSTFWTFKGGKASWFCKQWRQLRFYQHIDFVQKGYGKHTKFTWKRRQGGKWVVD